MFLNYSIIYLLYYYFFQNPNLYNHNYTEFLCNPLTSTLPIFYIISALLTTLDNSLENASTSPSIFLIIVLYCILLYINI